MPAVPSFAAGARLNGLAFLVRPPIARLRRINTQNIINNVAIAVIWEVADIDTDMEGVGGHDAGQPTRYTARYPGWYQISGGMSFAPNATGVRVVSWSVNGSMIPGSDSLQPTLAGFSLRMAAKTELVYLAEGDYVELKGYQTSGGVLGIVASNDEQPTMNVRWVSS
jgi:hypothetical protein